MIRGTTPIHEFTLPFSTDMIKTIEITYAQNDDVLLTKGNADCTFSGTHVLVKLSQEDTFLFADGTCVEVQIRVLTIGDEVVSSDVMRIHCERSLSKAVLA